ncbi:MAG: S8 family peptidase [Stenotrophomonas sp.]|uniref:S8 family peptidase n=1 Tax=Stenotrophomonas sp. TaxID=69392 RepID=UPI003D6C932E
MRTEKKAVLASATLLGMLLCASASAASNDLIKQGTPVRVDQSGLNDNQSFGRFIITYRDGTTTRNNKAAILKNADGALRATGVAASVGNVTYLRALATGSDLVKVPKKLDRAEAKAFMDQIALDPNVLSVAPDVLRRAVEDIKAPAGMLPSTFVPSDPNYATYQWHLKAPDGVASGGNSNLGGANVNNAWDVADGNGIVIAILDTGITTHVDINTSLASAGYDFISDSLISGRATDDRVAGGWDTGDWTNEEPWKTECTNASNPPAASSWHGTHVASTAGAELTNNGVGMAGIAYNAKILPVRVLGHCGGYDSDINDAIVWAAGGTVAGVPVNANPAKVINLSLGGSGACPATDPQAVAIAKANALGATVVVSAGNSNADATNFSPASCPGAITVASTGITSKRAYYSNYGPTVEIAAPGGGVYPNDASTGTAVANGFVWQSLNGGTTTPIANDKTYGGFAGTSQAAPHVSGVIALMQGARLDAGLPLLTPTEVVSILQTTAHVPSVTPAANQSIGAGIVDAAAAVAKAIAPPPCQSNCGVPAIPLTNKVDVTGLAGAAGESKLYSFNATAGSVLSVITLGGTGDVSLYVSFANEPTTTVSDFKSVRACNAETVRVTAPQTGTYYIKLVGATAYSGVTLSARQ